ncbi:MAG: sigma-70 family RNA polymerase sigma factor [Gemmatimonadales bacterium]
MSQLAPIPPAVPTDADLVRAYRGGDEAGASLLVARHAGSLARFLAGTGADPGEIDDLVQETFYRAFRALDSWRGESAFRSWLLTIGSNLVKDQYRRGKGRTVLSIDDHDIAAQDDPAATLDASEVERSLANGLTRLPRLQREVFLLRAQQGMAYEDIAHSLKTTPGAARVHYHHAVKRLKELVA